MRLQDDKRAQSGLAAAAFPDLRLPDHQPGKVFMQPGFSDAAILEALENLSQEAIDALPYGVIRLDSDYRVILFSRPEAKRSGWGDRPALGLHFFRDIAPRMDTSAMRGRLERARERGPVDIEMDWTRRFDGASRDVRLRAISTPDGGWWLLFRPL